MIALEDVTTVIAEVMSGGEKQGVASEARPETPLEDVLDSLGRSEVQLEVEIRHGLFLPCARLNACKTVAELLQAYCELEEV